MPRKSEDRLLGEIEATLVSIKESIATHTQTDKEWHARTTKSIEELATRISDIETIKNKGWGVLFGLSLTSGLIGAGLSNAFKALFH